VRARRAVVSSAHLGLLPGLLEGWAGPPPLQTAGDRWGPRVSVFALQSPLAGDLSVETPTGPLRAAAAGLGSTTGMVRQIDAHDAGQADAVDPWLLVVNQTVVDPQRAPAGAATLKLLTIAPYTRSDGLDWATVKDQYAAELMDLVRARATGLGDADVLAVRAESPVDVAAHNPHNLGGSCHGGEFLMADGSVVAGWPSYRTSVPGLYVTGSTVHPGGSVSGRPGRNAARAVLEDLGIDPGQVMGAR
jgi:phytoene dehydrogenase-like protein